MSLKEQIYSILVVSSTDSFNSALTSLLPESSYAPVRTTASITAAKRAVTERAYDLVLINSPLPDDQGLRFAIDMSVSKNAVVLLIVKSDIHDEIYDRLAPHGVFTLPKPTSRSTMERALAWMISAREQLRHFEKKNLTIEQKMEEIRLVNRAKCLLISHNKMTEPDAHHFIEKQAMNKCVSKREIAEGIIENYPD